MSIFELKLSASKRLRKKYITVSLLAIAYWFIDVFRYGAESLQCNIFFAQFSHFLSDFTQVVGYAAYPDTYNCLEFMGLDQKAYPPLNYVVLRVFAPLADLDACFSHNYLENSDTPLLIIMYFLIVAVLMFFLFSVLRDGTDGSLSEKRLTALVLLLSPPVLCVIERGNILILSAVLTVFYVFNHNSENKLVKELALIALGFAFGLKATPAIFGFLLLYNKQYKEAVRASIYGLLFFFVPFLFMNGGFANLPLMIRNMGVMGTSYSHDSICSLWSCFNLFGVHIFDNFSKYIVCVYIFICSFFIKRKWEKVLALSLILLFAVDPSNIYCLLYLFPAAVMFLNEKEYGLLDWLTFIGFIELFLLLVNPFTTPAVLNLLFDKIRDVRIGILLLLFVVLVRGTRDTVTSLIELSAKKKPELLEGKVYLFFTGRLKTVSKPVNKKAAKVRLTVLLTVLAVVLTATAVVILNPDIPREYARHRAVKMYENGEYEKAIPIFERLAYFKDCQEYLDKCKTALNEA